MDLQSNSEYILNGQKIYQHWIKLIINLKKIAQEMRNKIKSRKFG